MRRGASAQEVVSLLADAAANRTVASCVFGVLATIDGATLRVAPLEGRHPSEFLVGWRAPRQWLGVGFVAEGSARGDVPGASTPVVVVAAVHRDGTSASALLSGDGPLPVHAEQGSGRLPDLLRHSLGLSTPVPNQPITHLWSVLWLDKVLNAALASTARLTWEAAVRLHPLCPDGPVPRPDNAAEAFADHDAAPCTWELFRGLVVAERAHLPGICATEAAWLDAGSFSRWVLTELPSSGQLTDALKDLVPLSLWRHVAAVVAGTAPVP